MSVWTENCWSQALSHFFFFFFIFFFWNLRGVTIETTVWYELPRAMCVLPFSPPTFSSNKVFAINFGCGKPLVSQRKFANHISALGGNHLLQNFLALLSFGFYNSAFLKWSSTPVIITIPIKRFAKSYPAFRCRDNQAKLKSSKLGIFLPLPPTHCLLSPRVIHKSASRTFDINLSTSRLFNFSR